MSNRYYKQPTAYELSNNIENTVSKAKKKGKKLEPIIIVGRKITNSFWGDAWCTNLERYADYESRIDRGKRYVRNGSVIDLKISPGKVEAKVQGSRRTPYKVLVTIDPLTKEVNDTILEESTCKIENIEALAKGEFPTELKDVFLKPGYLFPTPRQIHFTCSCPDWAYMCKHVAAVLYGIGAKFDENPLLFFELRSIDIDQFIDHTIQNRLDSMLKNADTKTSRVMELDALDDLFGNLYD